jgi:rhamnosyltransferase
MSADPSISQTDIAGVVVLYNSPPDCLENIRTYRAQIDRLYVVDNSPITSPWITSTLLNDPGIRYYPFPQNVGIATALNVGAQQAISDGYQYLLTMDDDSRAPADLVPSMIHYLTTNQSDSVGILAPKHILSALVSEQPTPERARANEVITTMTSGNLVNLAAYKQVGPFDDGLFIDVVDHDFDLRLKAAGYRIVELTNLYLIHRLGTQKRLPLTSLTFVSHSPARNYYLIRNSILVARHHWKHTPGYSLTAALTILIEIGKIVVLEDQNLVRLRLVLKAVHDAIRYRKGPLSQD